MLIKFLTPLFSIVQKYQKEKFQFHKPVYPAAQRHHTYETSICVCVRMFVAQPHSISCCLFYFVLFFYFESLFLLPKSQMSLVHKNNFVVVLFQSESTVNVIKGAIKTVSVLISALHPRDSSEICSTAVLLMSIL